MNIHLPVLIPLVPLALAPLCAIFSPKISRLTAFTGLALTLILGFLSFTQLLNGGPWHYNLGGWPPPWGITLMVTPFSGFLACTGIVVALASWFYYGSFWAASREDVPKEGIFYSLLLLFTATFPAMLFLRDTFSLYLCLELSLLAASALLVAGNGQNWLEGFYLFFYGSEGASFFLVGALFLYASTGTLHFDDLLAQLFISKNYPAALVAGFFTAAAFSLQFLFPLPSLFGRFLHQSPSFILGLLSSTLARAGAYMLFVFFFFVLGVPGMAQPLWLVILEYLLTLAFLWNFVQAARQKDFQLSVAFLSVAQLGYLFIGFLLGNKNALTGTLMEFLSQMLVVSGMFFIAGNLRTGPGPNLISRMAGLARHRPLTGLALVVFTASIVGVPPTGGFFGKYYLALGGWEKRDWVALGALGLAVAFNLVYFARLTVFLYEHRGPSLSHGPSAISAKAPILLFAALVLLLGIFHQEIIHNFIEPALPRAFQNLPVPNVPFLGHQVE
jgi:multicomponent Na+:H+ antiporter subunit D